MFLLAFLLESLLFFLERCDLILDVFQLGLHLLMLELLRLNLRLQLRALSFRAIYLLSQLLNP